MFKITNANHDPITREDGHFETDENGWSHTAWFYGINDGHWGVFRAGIAIRYSTDEELREAILESTARDIATATDYFTAAPAVRDLIGQLRDEFGESDPLSAYDTARELHKASRWYWSLGQSEQEFLHTIHDISNED